MSGHEDRNACIIGYVSRIKLYHDPKLILTKALEASAAHSCQVKPPWNFVSLSGAKRNE
jgi:hypothetical protein